MYIPQICLKKLVDSGQFYWGSLKSWKNKNLLHKNSIKLKIPNMYAQDLNNYKDLKILEIKKKRLLNQNKMIFFYYELGKKRFWT